MSTDSGEQATRRLPPGRAYSIAAFVLALLGLVMFPPGGLTAVVCGALARSRGDRILGVAAIVAGIVSFVASFFVAALVLG
jgi:hypothetical protein